MTLGSFFKMAIIGDEQLLELLNFRDDGHWAGIGVYKVHK
jgi:hypothetical protein